MTRSYDELKVAPMHKEMHLQVMAWFLPIIHISGDTKLIKSLVMSLVRTLALVQSHSFLHYVVPLVLYMMVLLGHVENLMHFDSLQHFLDPGKCATAI